MAAMRVACDDAAFSFASKGVKVSLIRLPTVHGVGDHGFIKQFVLLAKEKGVSGYIGDGTNRWPVRMNGFHIVHSPVLKQMLADSYAFTSPPKTKKISFISPSTFQSTQKLTS